MKRQKGKMGKGKVALLIVGGLVLLSVIGQWAEPGTAPASSSLAVPNTSISQLAAEAASAQPAQQAAEAPAEEQQQPTPQPTPEPQPEPPKPAPKEAPAAPAQSRTVYVTNTGEKYHADGCRYLSRSRIPILLDRAIAQGYTPCSVCGGG